MQNSLISTRITSLYGSPPSSVDVDYKTATFGPPYKSLWVPDLTCRLCIQNSDLRTKIAPLYGSQSSPVNFCIQNSMPSIRIISLYRSQTSSVVFAFKTARLAPELLVSMVPRPHLWMLTAKQRLLDHHTSLYGYQSSPVVLCMQNSDFRTRHTSPYGSLNSSVVLITNNSVLSTRIKRLYWFQPSPVVFACKTAPSDMC